MWDGEGVRLHPREELVRRARIDFLEVYGEWLQRHDELTYIEIAQLIAGEVQSLLKYALRVERHGDDQTAAGLVREEDEA